MFGFGRNHREEEAAARLLEERHSVQVFIEYVVKLSDKKFEEWAKLLEANLSIAGLNSKDIHSIVSSPTIKTAHFCALCAIEVLAIKNCYEPKRSSIIYDLLRQELDKSF